MYFVICPKQDPKTEGLVLHRVRSLRFCLKQGQGFKTSAALLYPHVGQSPPPPPPILTLLPMTPSFAQCSFTLQNYNERTEKERISLSCPETQKVDP